MKRKRFLAFVLSIILLIPIMTNGVFARWSYTGDVTITHSYSKGTAYHSVYIEMVSGATISNVSIKLQKRVSTNSYSTVKPWTNVQPSYSYGGSPNAFEYTNSYSGTIDLYCYYRILFTATVTKNGSSEYIEIPSNDVYYY